ncbi:MAG: hypothetical protein U9O64_04925, partial [Campylobacterota bacterium]|nr:hypothetical protein [Campylobacterota bacterium]
MSADTYKVLRQTPTSKKEGSKLASLWRNVVNDLNVVNAIGSLVLRHEKDSRARKTTAFKEKTTLQNDIVSNDMTFKVLIYLIDKLIKPKNITLTLTLTHENGME